jgi:FAD/FMN-containing dehydrogenase
MAIVANECAAAEPLDAGLLDRWLEHRNDVSALEALTRRGFVVDTMEIAGRWRDLPGIYERTREAILGVEGAMVASAHQSHSYLDGACLYFTFAGNPGGAAPDDFYRAAWDAGTRSVLAGGGALSHHHGAGRSRCSSRRSRRSTRRGSSIPASSGSPIRGAARHGRKERRTTIPSSIAAPCRAGASATMSQARP